ncbi:vacuolar segregation protein [Drechmeria coniospora]|uniref:Vacuolar segregation protein n=1 Tax=Drechmeria coniospora TaxID=98403 RepID=A0A151GXV8_DRECN|nr:vacuolar segregation protein [Drechmeria coniospora]KYK61920.1 vacuolar segregation protein [Drechmeria coniospora]
MSGRTLGGGRILGSGKGLAPPTPAPSIPPPSGSSLSYSESSNSLGPSSLSPPGSGLTDLGRDIGASISLGAPTKRNAAVASQLVCPICSEEMMTLLQLNRHIDDLHQELAEEQQDEVKTWFDKQVLKAKRFQPLSLINQKLRGLDVFESNESTPVPTPAVASGGKANLDGPVDPDELITRSHWQRSTAFDACTDPTCGKNLGHINGSINCRKCGRLFCEDHTMYQIKLSRSANHEPVRGHWARVCETCYKSREGYNDHTGVSVDHMGAFSDIRRKKVERQNLEISRLEKRVTKLTRLLANQPEAIAGSNGSLLGPVSSLMGQKDARKLLEQSVVTWEEDESVPKCPYCLQEFGSWTFRRHHCRVCGRVVCADPQTACSSEVSLDISTAAAPPPRSPSVNGASPEKAQANGLGHLRMSVRMCRECSHTIFSSRDFAASLLYKPPDQRSYETLRQFEHGIRQLLPSFHRVLVALQPRRTSTGETDLSKPPATHAQIQEAAKIRKRLIDSFGKYAVAAKRMRNLHTDSSTRKRLQEAVYTYANGFLHTNMLPLKSLPQILRHQPANSPASRLLPTPSHSSSSLRHTELAGSDAGSQAASETSTAVSQLETEEKDIRERLAVLEEQQFMVRDMMKMATTARRFEEVTALAGNLDELDGEIQHLRRRVGDVEQRWHGVYRDSAPV